MLQPRRRPSWRQCVTVEPVIFFYAYGLFMHLPIIQQYIYFRISQQKGFPYEPTQDKGCSPGRFNTSTEKLQQEVQSLSSYVQIGIVMFSSIPSIFMALFIGSWTDQVGRRPALALPAIGSAFEAFLTILVMYYDWPIYVLFVAGAVNGLCGYFTTMVLAVMSYIADTTDESDISFRLAILELLVFMGGMVSQLTSGLWIEQLGYRAPYWFILSCHLVSFTYVIFFVPESRPRTTEHRLGFFNLQGVKKVWHVYKVPRNGARRNLILLLVCCGVITSTTLGVVGVIVLFVLNSPLCFSSVMVGYFCAARYTTLGLGAVLGIKGLGRCVTELNIARIGMTTLILSFVLFGFSKKTWIIFMVPVAGFFNGAVLPIFRGMMSRIVGPHEQGAVFSAVASMETLCSFVGTFIFNALYPASLKHNFPGFVFFLGAVLVVIPHVLVCFLRNPSSFMSKKDIANAGPSHDEMTDDLLQGDVGSDSDCESPLHHPDASVPRYQAGDERDAASLEDAAWGGLSTDA